MKQTLKKPRITEKAGIKADSLNVYTFVVENDATKKSIKTAIKQLYKVEPLSVNIINLPSKKVTRGGKSGRTSSVKKAMIKLKKGDKIDFI